jgi:hypothetical protein
MYMSSHIVASHLTHHRNLSLRKVVINSNLLPNISKVSTVFYHFNYCFRLNFWIEPSPISYLSVKCYINWPIYINYTDLAIKVSQPHKICIIPSSTLPQTILIRPSKCAFCRYPQSLFSSLVTSILAYDLQLKEHLPLIHHIASSSILRIILSSVQYNYRYRKVSKLLID